MISNTKIDREFDELKIAAATKVEDGESTNSVTEYLIQNKGANRLVAENIVEECYNSRQKHFRVLGVIFVYWEYYPFYLIHFSRIYEQFDVRMEQMECPSNRRIGSFH
jgi:hypothetical protein